MQRLSYDQKNPVHEIFGERFSLEIFTLENVYGIDPERTEVKVEGDRAILTARGLTWAGGRETCEGGAMFLVEKTAAGLTFKLEAAHRERLRAAKVIVHRQRGTSVTSDHSENLPIMAGGMTFDYPHWNIFMLRMPIVFLKGDKGYISFSSVDDEVTPKRFSFIPEGDAVDVELIYEAPATRFASAIATAAWEIAHVTDPGKEAQRFLDKIAGTYGLAPFNARPDVPDWMRRVSLVLSIHGMHFSGYIFNTYKEMLSVIKWFADRMPADQILAYLPGWEGRYYWQYGDYRPEPRLGGPEGFARLVEGAHALGARVMPMFGANCTNREHPDFSEYGPISLLHDASGAVFLGNKPDWSGDRSYDPGWQIWLNPAAPAWQERLLETFDGLIKEFKFDGVFLDTDNAWTNDPYYPLFDGYKAVKTELKSAFPELLIAGEGWYDALLAITPLTQMGGPPHWPGLFEKYARSTPHLSAPSPCRGSTGVHELGYAPYIKPGLKPGEIPMVTIVDGTLAAAPDALMDYVKLAEEYAKKNT
jgi:hypothetical protein